MEISQCSNPNFMPIPQCQPIALQIKNDQQIEIGQPVLDEPRASPTPKQENATGKSSNPPPSDAYKTGNPKFKGQWSELFSDNRRPSNDFLMKKVGKQSMD
ncbi:hypothetical protein Dimus_032185 [Dionaea muscipula]